MVIVGSRSVTRSDPNHHLHRVIRRRSGIGASYSSSGVGRRRFWPWV
jgi:hypothetical protein